MSSYERDQAMRDQEATEEMIRMRQPEKAARTTIPRADIGATGPYDGMGNYAPTGAYIHLFISVDGGGLHTFRTSHHGAEQLLKELQVALRLNIDRFTGSVIDAYTLAPNDEEAKREAVRDAITRELAR